MKKKNNIIFIAYIPDIEVDVGSGVMPAKKDKGLLLLYCMKNYNFCFWHHDIPALEVDAGSEVDEGSGVMVMSTSAK